MAYRIAQQNMKVESPVQDYDLNGVILYGWLRRMVQQTIKVEAPV